MNKKVSSVEDYINQFEGGVKEKLLKIRRIIKKCAPDAEENISYGMPGYKTFSKPLIYFGGFKNHISIFPAGKVSMFENLLKDYKYAKGTIQFQSDEELPLDLIEKITKERVKQNEEMYRKY